MRYQAAVLLLATALLTGYATSPQARTASESRDSQRALAKLAKRADADSLAAAGLLSLVKHRDQSLALFERAVAAEPARADLVWLETRSCEQAPPCDPEPLERRLRVLDPTNGAGWLGALARAESQKDSEAKQEALAAIARSARVDIYWTTLIAKLSRAVAQTKAMSLGNAEISVIGLLAAEALPAYRVASDACKGERLQRAEVAQVCRGIAKAFEQGDTYATALLGAAIAMRVWPKQSPEWQAANDARRAFEYRSKLLTALEDEWPNPRAAQSYLALCARYRREQDVSRAQLIQANLRPDPPAE